MENVTQQQNIQLNIESFKQLSIMNNDLATVHYKKKNYKEALKYFEEAIKYFDILYRLINKSESNNAELINLLQQQINDAKFYIVNISEKLGDEKFDKGDYEGAVEYYKNIITHNLNEKSCIKISECLKETGAYLSAVSFLNTAVNINPKNTRLYVIIGSIYENKLKDFPKAIYFYNKYIETETEDKITLSNAYLMVEYLLHETNKYASLDTQIDYLKKAIELNPNNLNAYRNLAFIYPAIKEYQKALDCYKKIFELGATMDDFFSYACLNIKLKNFKEGWKYYEYRFSKEENPTYYPKMPKPKWKGEDISEKTLLVECEQGFGDSIQFYRYILEVKHLAKKVIFRVQDEMESLFRSMSKEIEIAKRSSNLEKIEFDCHVPIMSLPYRLGATVENIPSPDKYIFADEKKVKKYKKEYFDNNRIKIGISWRGSASGNLDRNVPFETFFPIGKLKNVQLYSFQRNITVNELDKLPLGMDVVKLGRSFKDFSDTAAAMANIDYFITSDNGVFNLAGAMGVKTCLLLNSNSEWRWFTDGDTTPWYNNVRIFRKENDLESWESLMHKVIDYVSKDLK